MYHATSLTKWSLELLSGMYYKGRNQGRLRWLKPPPLNQIKVEKKDKKF